MVALEEKRGGDNPSFFIMCDGELIELVKSIKNRCDIFLIICELPHAQKLLPTLLEDLYVDSQTIIDEYCVKDAIN